MSASVHHINAAVKPSQSIIYVDPAMARRVLAKNTRNRPISELHVQKLAREMESGRWAYNGEAIKWSVDDVLLDGQHRLTALSRMPDDFPAIPFLVVRGLPTDVQDTMDQGRMRAASDQLVIDGVMPGTDARIVAGAIRVHLEWHRMTFFKKAGVLSNTVSNTEVVAWAHDHPLEVSLMGEIICTQMRRVKARPSVTLAVLLHFHLIDGEAAREFAAALYSGAGLGADSPILALRERLDRIRAQKTRLSDRDLIAYFIIAWNAWRLGRPLSRLQGPRGGSWTVGDFPKAI